MFGVFSNNKIWKTNVHIIVSLICEIQTTKSSWLKVNLKVNSLNFRLYFSYYVCSIKWLGYLPASRLSLSLLWYWPVDRNNEEILPSPPIINLNHIREGFKRWTFNTEWTNERWWTFLWKMCFVCYCLFWLVIYKNQVRLWLLF